MQDGVRDAQAKKTRPKTLVTGKKIGNGSEGGEGKMQYSCKECGKRFTAIRPRENTKYCTTLCANRAKSSDAAKASHINNRMKNGQASAMGKKSRQYENIVAETLPFKEMYLPQEICDRIAVVDGKLIFIEIKQKGQKLRPIQKRIKEVMGEDYLVVYG